jgi:hypothetical protein
VSSPSSSLVLFVAGLPFMRPPLPFGAVRYIGMVVASLFAGKIYSVGSRHIFLDTGHLMSSYTGRCTLHSTRARMHVRFSWDIGLVGEGRTDDSASIGPFDAGRLGSAFRGGCDAVRSSLW